MIHFVQFGVTKPSPAIRFSAVFLAGEGAGGFKSAAVAIKCFAAGRKLVKIVTFRHEDYFMLRVFN